MAQIANSSPEETSAVTLTFLQKFSNSAWGTWLRRLLFYAALIAIWELVFRSGIWQDYILPGPGEVANSLITGFTVGEFLTSALNSLAHLAIGYAISLVFGLIVGLLIGRVRIIKETIGSLVLGLQALPSICWLPMAILWFGLSDTAIIFVVVMGALFSITLGVEAGVRNTPPIYLKAARNMGAKGIGLYTQVILPAALPSIISGLKQGWSFAWRSLMAGELIYNTASLGALLDNGRDLNDASQLFAVMFLIIVIGVAIDALIFAPLERATRTRWGLTA